MFICTAIASALVLAPAQEAKANTVQYYDRIIQVSERVLDRSICGDIERVHPIEIEGFDQLPASQQEIRRKAITQWRIQQREAMESHCRSRVGVKNENECDLN